MKHAKINLSWVTELSYKIKLSKIFKFSKIMFYGAIQRDKYNLMSLMSSVTLKHVFLG